MTMLFSDRFVSITAFLYNGSIFKEAEKLHEFGIEAKNTKSGKKFIENKIPEEFLTTEE